MTKLGEVRIFFCTLPTNMSYSFDSLMGRAEQLFRQDPLSGHLFLFLNRRRDRMKILFWDRDGLAIFYKRLEKGTFEIPAASDGRQGIELDPYQLTKILEGIDLRSGCRRKRYRRRR